MKLDLRTKIKELKIKIRRFFTFEVVRDPELIRAYIGANYAKFETRRFNIAGFFFSVIYLLFRKLYVAGVVVFVLEILLTNLIHAHISHLVDALVLGIIVNFAFSLIIGFLVNRYYIFAVGVKIGRLKIRFPKRSKAETRGICVAKGGTNSIALTFGLLAKVISSVAMVINMLFSDMMISLENPFSETIETIRSQFETVVDDVKDVLQDGAVELQDKLDKSGYPHEKIRD